MVIIANRMALIEGVGDEVVIFIGIVVLVSCIILAWFSTSVADQPLIRTTVLIIERRRTSSRINNETVQRTTTNVMDQASVNETRNTVQSNKSSNSNDPSTSRTMTTDETEMNNDGERRSSQIENEESQSADNEEPCYLAEVKKSDKYVRKRTMTDTRDEEATNSTQSETIGEEQMNSDSNSVEGVIRIRLKFLNDTQRMVEGKLEEPLGEFKRRYFGEELENDKIVRLIFNGQLLRSDRETLQFYGLFDNCVVHCQISNSISPAPTGQSETYNELDLSRFMLPLFGVILGAIWYCRVQYRQFFNATSTFALLGITGLFFVSLVALFIPRRENRQPAWMATDDQLRR